MDDRQIAPFAISIVFCIMKIGDQCANTVKSARNEAATTKPNKCRRLDLGLRRHQNSDAGKHCSFAHNRRSTFGLPLLIALLLICGHSTRLCGLPPTRPRQTSDPVFPGKRQPRVSSSLRIFGVCLSARHTCLKRAGFSKRSSRCPCKIDDYCPIGLRRFSRKRTALSSEIASSTPTFLASVARTTIDQHRAIQ